jgi:hypothetical protein
LKRWILLGAALLMLSASADEKVSPSSATSINSPSVPQPGAAKQNPVTQAFGKAGVKRCLGRIEQVTSFLTSGAKSGVTLFSPTGLQDKDSGFLSVSMEIIAGGLTYATAGFHPRQNNDCGGVYETVTYWQNPCDDVVAKNYAQMKPLGAMLDQVQMLQGTGSVKVFLMPAGQGCVAIKKEVIF